VAFAALGLHFFCQHLQDSAILSFMEKSSYMLISALLASSGQNLVDEGTNVRPLILRFSLCGLALRQLVRHRPG